MFNIQKLETAKDIGVSVNQEQKMSHWFNSGNTFESGGGVLRFELDGGVPLEPQNPCPFLRVILAEKGTHF